MRDVARRYGAAARAFGPMGGLAFVKHEVSRRQEAVAMTMADDGETHRVWLRPNTTDLAVFLQIFKEKEYDFRTWPPYRDSIDARHDAILVGGKTPLIIDGGANAGFSALWFALRFPAAKIIAVEPDPENFAVLQQNVAKFANIEPVQAALWNERTSMSLKNPADWAWGRRFDESDSETALSSVTIPDLIDARPGCVPLIVKLDIEGAEVKLLSSNTDWVASFPLVIFEAHDNLFDWLGAWQGSAHAFYSVLSRQKREYLARGENVFAFLHPAS